MSKTVMGFFLSSQIGYVLDHSDLSVLTHIAFFGIQANTKGGLHKSGNGRVDYDWAAWKSSRMTTLINKAHNAGTKVIFTLTRFSWNSAEAEGTVKLLSKKDQRIRLAKVAAAAVADRGVDGINVDFEPIPRSQRANFVDFVRRLRSELNARKQGLELTVASTGFISNYDVAGLTAPGAADAMFIMAYHYTGSWSKRAGAVSPLHKATYDVTDTVNAFLKYTTPDHIILGLPYYGNMWATTSGKVHAYTSPGHYSSVVYTRAVGIAATYGRRWDSVEGVPWVRWQTRACSSCPLTWRQMYYEDAQSLQLKHQLVIDKDLRGTGIWTLGMGGTGPELNDELRSTFGHH